MDQRQLSVQARKFVVDNGQGWFLDVKHVVDLQNHDPQKAPIVFIPGYCMNTFILDYHPTSQTLVRYLASCGYEVFTANLRGQGSSRQQGAYRRPSFGFEHWCLEDLPVIFETVQERSYSTSEKINAIGCSMGASIIWGWLAHQPDEHVLGTMISIGGPFRWEEVHPLMQVAFGSPALAGVLDIRGVRAAARAALPVIQRVPKLASYYLNTELVDVRKADELVKTIDDPVPKLNRQIAVWMRRKDFQVHGKNVTEALRGSDIPTFAIWGNGDGIVPARTAGSIADVATNVQTLEVGDERFPYAHADLFISRDALEKVWTPMRQWLDDRQ